MTTILHLARADVRRWRWAFVAALVLIALQRLVLQQRRLKQLLHHHVDKRILWCATDAFALGAEVVGPAWPASVCAKATTGAPSNEATTIETTTLEYMGTPFGNQMMRAVNLR